MAGGKAVSSSKTGFSVGGPSGLDVTVAQIVLGTSKSTVRDWLYQEITDLLDEYHRLFKEPK